MTALLATLLLLAGPLLSALLLATLLLLARTLLSTLLAALLAALLLLAGLIALLLLLVRILALIGVLVHLVLSIGGTSRTEIIRRPRLSFRFVRPLAIDENAVELACSPRIACHAIEMVWEADMGRYLLLWLLGIPLPILVLIWAFGGLH